MANDSDKPDQNGKGVATRLGPTVIAPPAERRRSADTASLARENTTRPVASPTAIPGTERKRLAAGDDELRRLSPASSASVRAGTRKLLETVVVERMNDRQAVLFGHHLQTRYSELVSATLDLSQAPVLTRVAGYVARMGEILSSIDLDALAGGGAGGLGDYLKRMNRRIDSPEELAGARQELDQLVRLMADALEDLLGLKDKLEKQAGKIDAVAQDIEAGALAAQFLAERLGSSQPAIAQRLIDRSISLTQTLAQIRSNSVMRDAQIDQPLRLIASIQNVALVMVPGWLSSIASLGAMLRRNKKPTQTEAGEIAFQLRNIVQQLNR